MRHFPYLESDGNPAGQGDSDRLADQQAEEDSHSHGTEGGGILEDIEICDIVYHHSGIGQGEYRHYDEIDPGIQCVFHAVAHPDRALRDMAYVPETGALVEIRERMFILILYHELLVGVAFPVEI